MNKLKNKKYNPNHLTIPLDPFTINDRGGYGFEIDPIKMCYLLMRADKNINDTLKEVNRLIKSDIEKGWLSIKNNIIF